MALCAYCQAETELYDSGDVPICIECSEAREARRKPPAIEQEIRTTLFEDVFEATAQNNEANREFEAVIGQFPSGLPHPKGAERIKNASNSLAVAREKKMKAHNRLNDYLGRGIVPEDLKNSMAKTAGK
jgi:hypothetical protein